MNKEISTLDKAIIYYEALKKLLRGLLLKPLLKKSSGFLFVGYKTKITHKKHIVCGKNVKFEDYAEIQGLCKNDLVFSDNVTIGRSTMIRPSSYYGKDVGQGLYVGSNSSIGPHSYIGCSGKIIIGNNVMIGPKCSMFAENHVFSNKKETIKSQGVVQKGIVIEDNCWIGSNVVILDGVVIGSGSVIGANTLVTKNIDKNTVTIDIRTKKTKKRH